MDDMPNDRDWLRQVLARIEDHILEMRRFRVESEKRWKANDERWKANHKLLVSMVEDLRRKRPGA